MFALMAGIVFAASQQVYPHWGALGNLHYNDTSTNTTITSIMQGSGGVIFQTGVTVGSAGTLHTLLKIGTVTVATSTTAATITGLLPSDAGKIFLTPPAAGTAYIIRAVPTTNTLTFLMSATPSPSLTIGYLLLR